MKLRHADQEIRLAQDPFPLYPGEGLKQVVTQLKVVPANTALRLRAVLDFQEEDGTRRVAGDEWLFEGPGEEGEKGSGRDGTIKGEVNCNQACVCRMFNICGLLGSLTLLFSGSQPTASQYRNATGFIR